MVTKKKLIKQVGTKTKLNDKERSQWIDNDEGLWGMWQRSKLNKREFIKKNRSVLDQIIGQWL